MEASKFHWCVQYKSGFMMSEPFLTQYALISATSCMDYATVDEYIKAAQFKPEDEIIAIFKITKTNKKCIKT